MIFKMFYFSLKLQVVLKYDDEKGFTKTPKAIDILLPESGKGRPLGHIPLKKLHFCVCVCDIEYLDHSFLLISVSLLFIKAGTLGQADRQLGTLLSESAELSDWSHIAQSDPVSCYIQNLSRPTLILPQCFQEPLCQLFAKGLVDFCGSSAEQETKGSSEASSRKQGRPPTTEPHLPRPQKPFTALLLF